MSVTWQPHDVYTEDRRQALENQQPLNWKLSLLFYSGLLILSLGIWAGLFYGGNLVYRMVAK